MSLITLNISNPIVEEFLINYSKIKQKSVEDIINELLLAFVLQQDINNNEFEKNFVYKTTELEKQYLLKSEQDFKLGKILTNEQVFNEIDDLLNKKQY